MIALSPHIQPRRLRANARQLAEQLRTAEGFREGSKATFTDARTTGWPPLHYRKHGDLGNMLVGTVDGLTVRVAGYELVSSTAPATATVSRS